MMPIDLRRLSHERLSHEEKRSRNMKFKPQETVYGILAADEGIQATLVYESQAMGHKLSWYIRSRNLIYQPPELAHEPSKTSWT
jgi:hypothetical protein